MVNTNASGSKLDVKTKADIDASSNSPIGLAAICD